MREWRNTSMWPALVLGAAVMFGAPLVAHHSFALVYLEQDTMEVEGDIVEFQFKNPHAWIHVQGQEKSGVGGTKIYSAEWQSTSRLDRDGITKTTLHIGDVVRIWASPNRNPNDYRIRLKRIERRSDGWKWGGQRGRENR